MFAVPIAGWQRVAVAALLVIPFVLAIVLTTPGWLLWIFLPAKQRQDFLALNGKLIEWARVIAGGVQEPPGKPKDRSTMAPAPRRR
ncbi:MAG: hypothetical protein ACR2MP_32970 [Streptosporangiaceae bacterium]